MRLRSASWKRKTNSFSSTLRPRQLLAIAGDRLPPDYRNRAAHDSSAGRAHSRSTMLFRSRFPGAPRTAGARSPFTWAARSKKSRPPSPQWRTADEAETALRSCCAAHALRSIACAARRKHVLWAYCHVPNGSAFDMTERIEAQIERFAPGFRDCVLARRVSSPAALEAMDANLVGGDISGGAMTMRQILFRPTLRGYATGTPNLFLCSASTPPGGGVHGMCGYHAARCALRQLGQIGRALTAKNKMAVRREPAQCLPTSARMSQIRDVLQVIPKSK